MGNSLELPYFLFLFTLPGYTHANKIWQRYDGSDSYAKLDLWAEVIVFLVSVANNQSDQYNGN